MQRTAIIRRCQEKDIDPTRPRSEQLYCLFTKDGNSLLGRHPTKKEAEEQERAIQIRKHQRAQQLYRKEGE